MKRKIFESKPADKAQVYDALDDQTELKKELLDPGADLEKAELSLKHVLVVEVNDIDQAQDLFEEMFDRGFNATIKKRTIIGYDFD